MKQTRWAVGLLSFALVVPAVSADAAPKTKTKLDVPGKQTVQLDLKNSRAVWKGKKVTGAHNGTVALKSGHVELTSGQLTGGQFTIDLTSMTVDDIQGDAAGKLLGHLNSDDFFSVAKHPTANFKITNVKPLAAGTPDQPTHGITGDLTIKGITKPVTFPATITIAGKKATGVANVEVDRTLYDIRYGSGKFFQDLGDKMIDDKFTVQLQLAANL